MTNPGYLIVPINVIPWPDEDNIIGYRGIDRCPFTYTELMPVQDESTIEWEKKNRHFKQYEVTKDECIKYVEERKLIASGVKKIENEEEFLVSLSDSLKLFRRVRGIVDEELELIKCFPLLQKTNDYIWQMEGVFLGFDVGWAKNSFFSSIRHGLLGHMESRFPELKSKLNKHLLFQDIEHGFQFLSKYMAEPDREEVGDFFVIAITQIE